MQRKVIKEQVEVGQFSAEKGYQGAGRGGTVQKKVFEEQVLDSTETGTV